MATLADQLVEVLLQQGVSRVYGVVGDSLNPVVDAIRRAEGIDWVQHRTRSVARHSTYPVAGRPTDENSPASRSSGSRR